MRFVFSAGKDTFNAIKEIQDGHKDADSMGSVVVDSIHFLFQMETLMDSGYKIAIVDPDGKQHYISKRGEEEEEEEKDDYGTPPENQD